MKFLSIEPFIPSGSDYESSKQLFQALGFQLNWEADGMAGFERDGCKFILQQYDNVSFAENLMLSVRITNADEFYWDVTEKQLAEKFGIRVSKPINQPYGREVNLIDLAGVCWHFVE
ncbi:VOC family protein [Spirosoma fluminis]